MIPQMERPTAEINRGGLQLSHLIHPVNQTSEQRGLGDRAYYGALQRGQKNLHEKATLSRPSASVGEKLGISVI